jgi:hypothetical protein
VLHATSRQYEQIVDKRVSKRNWITHEDQDKSNDREGQVEGEGRREK